MANRERGELRLRAEDGAYTLRLSTSSCCELETATEGRTLEQVIDGVNAGVLRDLRWLTWTALRDRHADVATIATSGLAAVGRLIDRCGGYRRVVDRLRLLVELNLPPSPTGPVPPGGAFRPLRAQLV
jgi:hypothetical protein